ncbi:ATP-binding cassette domain-containing protein [Kribbella solani]|uniref:ATP-binding cassette domain-containing protein n=1 Tax=Kribbella solani TaxID=236067 RepID=UPI0029B56B28|nr:ATP-binding cassette domain-containing protein [Kribbella solani]MDX2973844.1 ATP-binding cassette domain-containing protein [Kribbella solani]
MAVIEAAELVKEFSRPAVLPGRLPRLRGLFSTKREITRAVSGVNFQVEPGELVGYLGPNGAGKSTTVLLRNRLPP